MHNVSVKMNDEDFSLLDNMAKKSHLSRASVLCEALRIKQAFDRRENEAVLAGLESARNKPLLSDEDANKHFERFSATIDGQ